jgi:hypothetical protein
MTETWTSDDDVLRTLGPLDCGASVGFVAACLHLSDSDALFALLRLEARGLLVSGITESSGGTSRCWRLALEGSG